MADLWIEVDLDAVIHNYHEILAKLSPECQLMAVVKADAYGLGAVEVAKSLEAEGCRAFAVTTIAEALILRREGLQGRILVLGPSSKEDWGQAIAQGVELTVSQLEWIPLLEETAVQNGCEAFIHLKLETGMGRTGFTGDQLTAVAEALQQSAHLSIVGAYTHFARGAQRDQAYTRSQYEKFQSYVGQLEEMGLSIPLKHVCNSAAFLDYPEYHLNMVRVGTLLGGHFPAPAFAGTLNLKDPWTAKAKIVHLQKAAQGTYVGYQSIYKCKRDTSLAVVPVGYADGFGLEPKLVPQGLADLAKIFIKNTAALLGLHLGREKILLRGQTVSTAGKIGMQLTVLDTGRLPVELGEEVVIPLRRTLANPRIPRIYKKNGKIYRKRVIEEGFLSINEESISLSDV